MYDTEQVRPPSAVLRAITLISIGIGLVAFLVLSGCGGTGAASHHTAAAPRATVSTFTPSPSAVTAMGTWCAGAGHAMLRHVQADISQVSADAQASDLAAAEADGGPLSTDAEAAEQLPPPVTHAQQLSYVKAMGALSFAGTDLSAGNVAAANRAIGAAGGYLDQDKGMLTC